MEQYIGLVIVLILAFVVIYPWVRRENLECVPRKHFATWFIGWIFYCAMISFNADILEALLATSVESFWWTLLIAVLFSGIFQFKFNCIVLGRIKDAGWKPWLYWVGLVLPIQIVLLFVPTRR